MNQDFDAGASADQGEELDDDDSTDARLPVVSDEPSVPVIPVSDDAADARLPVVNGEPPVAIDPASDEFGEGLGLRWADHEELDSRESDDRADAKYRDPAPKRPDDAPKHLPKKKKKVTLAVEASEPEPEPEPKVGDWIILASSAKPWFGILTAIERDDQLVVHSWNFARRGSKKDAVEPLWSNEVHRTKQGKKCPKGWEPTKWRVTSPHIIHFEERADNDFSLPARALQAIADYKRDPRKAK
jgi:hypothetical protein